MEKTIFLWPGKAPYSDDSPAQAQPSIREFSAPGAKSAIIICPGGGYVEKVPHEKDPIAHIYQHAGISSYVLDYRVKPCHYEAPLTDALRAIRLVRSIGYEKVAIVGFSAGGHVCCSAATLFDMGNPTSEDTVERISSRPDAFIAIYPVVSFSRYQQEDSLENLLGAHKSDERLLRRFSAELNITDQTPPGFLSHSCNDQTVSVGNSLQLGLALTEHKIPFVLHVFQGGFHGAGVVGERDRNAEQWAPMSIDWLRSMGF